MIRNLNTAVVSLLMMLILSSVTTGVSAQSKGKAHVARKTSGVRGSHVGKGSYATRGTFAGRRPSANRGSYATHRNRKVHVGVTITLSRTTRRPINMDPASALMTQQFLKQKGHLSWPVDSKKVITHFGYQNYEPDSSIASNKLNVKVNNLGINIAIGEDSCVRVVYDGVVDDVMDIGDARAVIVLHGKYFTIYSDLAQTYVVKGQQLTAGDVVGQVGASGQVDFRIYDPYDVWQNPEKWLLRSK